MSNIVTWDNKEYYIMIYKRYIYVSSSSSERYNNYKHVCTQIKAHKYTKQILTKLKGDIAIQ